MEPSAETLKYRYGLYIVASRELIYPASNQTSRYGPERLHLTDEQLAALIQGLPWQRLGSAGVISVL